MSSEASVTTPPDMPDLKPRLFGIALLVLGIVLAGAWLVSKFTAADLARDLQAWQEKLNLIAESRTTDVDQWVGTNFKELKTLADNPSLQLYMTELQSMKQGDGPAPAGQPVKTPETESEPAQKVYLRNLVVFSAQRAGFSIPNSLSAIPANVPQEGENGLAIIDSHNAVVVSTPMADETRDLILGYAVKSAPGKQALIDIHKSKNGVPVIGFLTPVFSIQGDRDAGSQIGWVVGVKAVDSNLFALLKPPGITEKTLETVLVRNDGGMLTYISPLQDGTAALNKSLPFDPAKMADAKLIASSGSFVSEMSDYRNKPVLATSRAITGTPWTLVVKVDRAEALAASNQHRASMEVFFFMLIAVIVLVIVALWRYAHSKRSLMMSSYFRTLAAEAVAQEKLVRLVADNQQEAIYIVDNAQTVRFANHKAAQEANMSPDSVAGKSLADVRGAAAAEYIAQQCELATKQGQVAYDVQRMQIGGEDHVIRSAYVPIAHIPVAALREPTPGVLVVEQDISEAVHEREKRLESQRQLIETLVRLVDRRDPFSANHSQLVSHLAQETAMEMKLDEVTSATARIAGSLMNIGKIIVPRDLLTKTGTLTPEEKRVIHDSMNAAADLLKDISFDGPVAETLRQWQEEWNGSGPTGIKGESILVTARIIAVANAFVGMISPRSWRTAMPIEAANKFLLEQSDTHFDRRVVVALINYVENHQGKAWITKVLQQKHVA